MIEQYSTTNIFFAAALQCEHGESSLTSITRSDQRGTYRGVPIKLYTFEVESREDASSMFADFLNGRLGVSDIREYMRVFSNLTKICKTMEREGHDSWGVLDDEPAAQEG